MARLTVYQREHAMLGFFFKPKALQDHLKAKGVSACERAWAKLPHLADPFHSHWQASCHQGKPQDAVEHTMGFGLDRPAALELVNHYRRQNGLMPARSWWNPWRW